ncbi:hypothetical protein BCL57_000845 [Agromyces flavus]|uniref:Uncharacterized protein n=1 Tax=Agromyces flavus TaxID=589382 RepID=A0A1H1YID2_9MICO|nr:hypothetical protein [Agromyces flavus]MCP2366703.1 hypothetical protein [Agromyces flavus]GGI45206.1 hypothetical protein GCM10010932_08460 [Agromyces flavus]SDT21182.1 hypothetical protein SAMN04489721_2778 [Agromyces flavus]
MANLRVHNDRLEVHLTPAEKTLAFRSADVIVQRDDIRSATITDDPWIWIRGIRRRGTEVPLVIAIGAWKTHGGSDFVVVKGKRQAVVLELAGGEFARLVLSTNRAGELVEKLRVGVPTGHHVADEIFAEEETSGD